VIKEKIKDISTKSKRKPAIANINLGDVIVASQLKIITLVCFSCLLTLLTETGTL